MRDEVKISTRYYCLRRRVFLTFCPLSRKLNQPAADCDLPHRGVGLLAPMGRKLRNSSEAGGEPYNPFIYPISRPFSRALRPR